MKEQIKALLKALGMKDEAIEKYLSEDAETIKALEPKKDATAVQNHLKEVLKNDPAFVDTFKSQARAAVLSSKEKKFKELFELTDEDVETLPEKNRYDDMIKLGFKRMQERLEEAKKKGKTGDDAKDQIAALNKQIVDLKTAVKDYEEVKLPGAQKEADTKVASMQQRFGLLNKLHSKSADMLIKPEFAIDKLMAELQGQYALVTDAAGKMQIKQKDNPEMEVYVDNELLTVDKAVESFLSANELIKQSNGSNAKGKGGNGGNGGNSGGTDDDKPLPPHMQKALEHEKSLTGDSDD